ncbi:zinc finger BED domain-containing protein RICESLEEPER 2 [Artemisia annua]|uniref:Zinc finger BED domain-containing protein RICESLEEPER 2 n=1 Tax=Artemisia annua TaxID=35608 RepID=A0A2U1QNY9_ARTAN|nr:zinc finger BED domain-containing protein RICESLEEPER 2 [Artemisia annua]
MAPQGKRKLAQKNEQEDGHSALIKEIIIDELPFSVVDQDGFKEYMEARYYRGFQIPSHETIARDCVQVFMEEKANLKSLIKKTDQRVCLTLNIWTSKQSVKYLCISAHFIDNNWELHNKIIGFSPLTSDDGEEIGRAVEKCLLDWEISGVLTISTGSASSYDAAIDYLRTRLVNKVLDAKFLHLKCIIDFINDLVKDGLNLYPESVARVREAVRYVRGSPARVELLKKCSRERTGKFGDFAKEKFMKTTSFLFLDSPAIPTSTYCMLMAANIFQEAFDLFEQKDPMYKRHMEKTCGVLKYNDWGKVSKVENFLKVFYTSTDDISEMFLTSNKFLVEMGGIDFHLHNWGRCANKEKLSMMALDMKAKFYYYWGDVEKSNMLIYVANILDPRQKLGYIEFYFENIFKHDYTDEGEKMWKHKMRMVLTSLYDVFDDYKGKIGGPQGNADAQSRIFMEKYLAEEQGDCTSRLMKDVNGLVESD